MTRLAQGSNYTPWMYNFVVLEIEIIIGLLLARWWTPEEDDPRTHEGIYLLSQHEVDCTTYEVNFQVLSSMF